MLSLFVGKQMKSAMAFKSAWFGLLLFLLISCFGCAIHCYVNTWERVTKSNAKLLTISKSCNYIKATGNKRIQMLQQYPVSFPPPDDDITLPQDHPSAWCKGMSVAGMPYFLLLLWVQLQSFEAGPLVGRVLQTSATKALAADGSVPDGRAMNLLAGRKAVPFWILLSSGFLSNPVEWRWNAAELQEVPLRDIAWGRAVSLSV